MGGASAIQGGGRCGSPLAEGVEEEGGVVRAHADAEPHGLPGTGRCRAFIRSPRPLRPHVQHAAREGAAVQSGRRLLHLLAVLHRLHARVPPLLEDEC